MIRKAFVMNLLPGQAAVYEQRHNPIWPELATMLKEHGAHNYSIFYDDETRQLFAYVEIEDEQRWQETATTEICQKWWQHMAPLMESNADGSPNAREVREVFHLA